MYNMETKRIKVIAILVVIFLLILLCRNRRNAITEDRKATDQLGTVYAITPTYARPVQIAELTRLSHVILLSPNVHWIIVEDAAETSDLVRDLVERSGLSERSTFLYAKTPSKNKSKDKSWLMPRGVDQRNTALQWIRDHVKETTSNAVVYFMDDDNTYSRELFREMRKIEKGKVGMWPVGLVGGLEVEKPIVNESSQVVGFNSIWRPERPFPIDMAGFAISVDLIINRPSAKFSFKAPRGYQESEILSHVTTKANLQPLANNCKDILVWHTRTESPKITKQ